MKIIELLERLSAPVYVNKENTLTVIPNLIEDNFGVDEYQGSGGMCLLSQFIFTLTAVTKIPVPNIARSFKRETDYHTGHSLQSLVDHFSTHSIYYKKKTYKLKISTSVIKNSKDVIKYIKEGQPITMIVDADTSLYGFINDAKYSDHKPHPGEANFKSNKKIRSIGSGDVYHALLLVGFDNGANFLIGRESRSSYGYKGYFRINIKDFDKQAHALKLLAIHVDDMEITDNNDNFDEEIDVTIKQLSAELEDYTFNNWRVSATVRADDSGNAIEFIEYNPAKPKKVTEIARIKDGKLVINLDKLRVEGKKPNHYMIELLTRHLEKLQKEIE